MEKVKNLDRKKILAILTQYKEKSRYSNKIKELGLFGSYTHSDYSKRSDIDVFIKLEPARMFDLISIKYELEKILAKKVDIVTLHKSMNNYLRNQIRQNGIYV